MKRERVIGRRKEVQVLHHWLSSLVRGTGSALSPRGVHHTTNLRHGVVGREERGAVGAAGGEMGKGMGIEADAERSSGCVVVQGHSGLGKSLLVRHICASGAKSSVLACLVIRPA